MKSNESAWVKRQYKDAANLKMRMSLHEKYSANPKGFGNWIFEQYNIRDNDRILELGCGNADIWGSHLQELPQHASLILTDFSKGMLSEAKTVLPQNTSVSFKTVDIQAIPYDRDHFDIVIANMMLYHVPNLNKGLSEVKRVLKPGGVFYCATYGEHNIQEYIQNLFPDNNIFSPINKTFTLQNGELLLRRYFRSVKKRIYEDCFEITNTEDLLDYVFSLTSMQNFDRMTVAEIRMILEAKKVNGMITIPKEYGLFLAIK